MTLVVELFYSPTCPRCPKARETVIEVLGKVNRKVQFDEVNIFSPEGLEKAEKYGVMAVPAIIINSRHKIVGIPAKDRLLRLINDETARKDLEGG